MFPADTGLMLLLCVLALIICAVSVLAVVTDTRRRNAGGPNAYSTDLDPAATAHVSAEVLRAGDRTA